MSRLLFILHDAYRQKKQNLMERRIDDRLQFVLFHLFFVEWVKSLVSWIPRSKMDKKHAILIDIKGHQGPLFRLIEKLFQIWFCSDVPQTVTSKSQRLLFTGAKSLSKNTPVLPGRCCQGSLIPTRIMTHFMTAEEQWLQRSLGTAFLKSLLIYSVIVLSSTLISLKANRYIIPKGVDIGLSMQNQAFLCNTWC